MDVNCLGKFRKTGTMDFAPSWVFNRNQKETVGSDSGMTLADTDNHIVRLFLNDDHIQIDD